MLRRLIRAARDWREGRAGRRVGRQLRVWIDEAYRDGYTDKDIYDIIIDRIDFDVSIDDVDRMAFLMALQIIIDFRDPNAPAEYRTLTETTKLFARSFNESPKRP